MLSGDFFKLFPLASNLLKPQTTGKWKPTVVGKSVYNFAFGLPSWGWILPREGVLGVNQVIIADGQHGCTLDIWLHFVAVVVGLVARLLLPHKLPCTDRCKTIHGAYAFAHSRSRTMLETRTTPCLAAKKVPPYVPPPSLLCPHCTLPRPQVVVQTPTRNYTVLEQKQLLLDMGDEPGVGVHLAGVCACKLIAARPKPFSPMCCSRSCPTP